MPAITNARLARRGYGRSARRSSPISPSRPRTSGGSLPSGGATGSGPGAAAGPGEGTPPRPGGEATRPARCAQSDTCVSLTWHSMCSKATGSTCPPQLRTTWS
jgi:hypothetical protein